MSGYSPPDAARSPQPSPLPVPAAPVAGETLASFTGRLAAVNRATPEALLGILPPWFRIKAPLARRPLAARPSHALGR
jgi:hypothetical protein